MQIRLKRAYDEPSGQDGRRILVDRVWPRGLKKEDAQLDRWLKNIAPSSGLRKWFGHDPDRWLEFRQRYFEELDGNPEAIEELLDVAESRRITLVFSARDRHCNNAVALKEYLQRRTDTRST